VVSRVEPLVKEEIWVGTGGVVVELLSDALVLFNEWIPQ
jgi:hypothetical protein